MFCPNCGRNVNDTAKFCVGCGTPLTGFEQQNQTVLLMPEANTNPMPESIGDNRVTYTTENMFYNESLNAEPKRIKKKSKKWPMFVVLGVLVITCGVFIAVLQGKDDSAAKKTTKKTETIKETLEQLEKANIGEYITFGTYEQDNDLENGAEPIEWRVLDKKDGKALVLSHYALDAKPYNEEYEDVTWETCTLRSWLNNEFYTTAFNKSEQSAVVETLMKNKDNSRFGTEGGNDTKDKVFLLSIEEVTNHFDSNSLNPARRVWLTEYAKAQGGLYNSTSEEFYGNGCWWLRSPGFSSDLAAVIGVDGINGINSQFGTDVDTFEFVVRPALWIAY